MDRRRPVPLVLAGLLLAAVAFAVAGSFGPARDVPAPTAAGSPVPAAPAPGGSAAPVTVAPAQTPLEHETGSGPASAAARRPLGSARTVRRALRRALAAGRLTRAEHDRMRRDYRAARRAVTRLRGARRGEMAAVVGQLRAMARRRLLTADRLDLAFLTLRRNTQNWTRRPMPPARARITFRGDPVIFEYYPGHGLQVQHLASFGKANALARVCAARRSRFRCRPASLRRTLYRLRQLAARRDGGLAWESWFAFGRAAPGWVSAMTQGTAAQAFARAGRALDEPRFSRAALRALRAFERRPPAGVTVRDRRGRHYVMYSTLPSLRVLNGHLQAVTALHDVTELTGSRLARRLYRRGDRGARAGLRAFDTGAWSLYSAGGAEASLDYHRLVHGFLGNLCRRARRTSYCGTERRFGRYLREPPRLQLARARRARPGRRTLVRFWLSKVSDVTVAVRGRRGHALHRSLRLQRGTHALGWVPPRHGRYRVSVHATGLGGPRAAVARTLRVRKPAKRKRREPARRPARHASAQR